LVLVQKQLGVFGAVLRLTVSKCEVIYEQVLGQSKEASSMSDKREFLKRLDMFNGLSDEEISSVAALCTEARYKAGDTILHIKDPADSLFLIRSGTVQIITNPDVLEIKPELADSLLVTLGQGQSFGEMGLVDRGARSATVRAGSDTEVYAINCDKLLALCQEDTHLGFMVMRNIAADLSFKLRYRNLI
jgi:CRP/FNR family cyclic AMP-dependent transcriptional regulator